MLMSVSYRMVLKIFHVMIVKTCLSKEDVNLEVEKRPTERQEDNKGK